MDEFNDLDKELEKLRAELSTQDELIKNFRVPPAGDYWKRRMDEEKYLWEKKLSSSEEEKKALESKIEKQQDEIKRYNEKIEEIDRKFEREVQTWNERLKTKEAELMLEKNRLLWEDKVRESEFDKKNLLEKIGELNAKINDLRDEQDIELNKNKHEYDLKKITFEERIQNNLKEIEFLQKRIAELDEDVKSRIQEKGQVENEYKQKIVETEKRVADQIEIVENINKEKNVLEGKVIELKKTTEEEKHRLEKSFRAIAVNFAEGWRKHIGKMYGLIQFVSNNSVKKPAWNIFKKLLQKLENETELLEAEMNVTTSILDKYKIVLLMGEDYFVTWSNILRGFHAEVVKIDAKTATKEIGDARPNIVVVSSAYLKIAKAVRKRWPFVPVVVAGEIKPEQKKTVEKLEFPVVGIPFVTKEIEDVVVNCGYHSITNLDHWENFKTGRKLFYPILVSACLIASIITGILFTVIPVKVPDFGKTDYFSTPYLRPTNISYDGRYMWSCDWYGQSIYKHSVGKKLEMKRIFYFPSKHITAITWAGGYLWSTDTLNKKVYKHNPDQDLTIVAKYKAPGSAPSGLASDGSTLWSCDTNTGKIYQHKYNGSLEVVRDFESPGGTPSGLYCDGYSLWSIDSRTNKIYRHKLDHALTVIETYLSPDYEKKSFNLSGITGSKGDIWICSEKSGRIYKYPLNRLKKINN